MIPAGPDAPPELFVFGPFALDAFTRTLRTHDLPVPLQPKTFELLEYFVRNPGRIIAKDEIFDAVWPGEEISDGNLTQQVFLLRSALARTSPRVTYIVAEPGRGYRFVARVAAPNSGQAPTNPEADRLYARGRYFYEKRTAESLHRSIHFFRQAIELEPTFGRAFAGLANAYALSAEYLLLAPSDAFPRAAEAARRALELDPALAEAYTVLGDVACHYDHDFERADRYYGCAATLAPQANGTIVFRAWFLCYLGRAREAAELISAAIAAEPYSLVLQTTLAVTEIFRRSFADAVDQLRAVLDMDPDYVHARFYLAIALQLLGRHDDALALAGGTPPDGYEQQYLALRGSSLGKLGRIEEARAAGEAMRALVSRGRFLSCFNLAWVALGMGDRDHAIRLLEAGYRQHDPWLVFLMEYPLFDELRDDARFTALTDRVRRPYN